MALSTPSIFVGGCSFEAVEEICRSGGSSTSDALSGMAALLDHSLLQQANQEGEQPRFVLLETVRVVLLGEGAR